MIRTVGHSYHRPAHADIEAGFRYFDTTMGQPIWSDGTQWVDADGSAVSAFSAPADPAEGVAVDGSFDTAWTVTGKCLSVAGGITLQAAEEPVTGSASKANTGITLAGSGPDWTITLNTSEPFTGTVKFKWNETDDPIDITFLSAMQSTADFTVTADSTTCEFQVTEAGNPVVLTAYGIAATA